MSAKRKATQSNSSKADTAATKRQHDFDRARQAHAKGDMCMEDFIWMAVQCYAGDIRNSTKTTSRFA